MRSGNRCRLVMVVCWLWPAFISAGCGHGGTSTSGSTSGGGSGITPGTEGRNAAISAAITEYGSLTGTTAAGRNQAMLTWIRANPLFVDSGIADGSVWAHFIDHTTLILVDNRKAVDDGTTAAARSASTAIDVPTPRTAHVINNFGGGNASVSSRISSMLAANGYLPASGSASVSALANLSGDGVFYIDTHGVDMTEDDGKDTYYLMASDVYDPTNTKAHDAGLQSHFLSVVGETQSVRQPDGTFQDVISGHYAISDRFASSNWGRFGQNSLVFINACSSAKTSALRSVCFAKGASAYAGWSGDVDNAFASKAAPFVFDRLLGANKVNVPADGPQRPFDYPNALGDMAHYGLNADVNGVTLSIVQNPGTSFGLLAPTISYMAVDELKQELTINGVFGTVEGTVTVGGTPINPKSWGFNSIICDLPPDLSGDVIVEVNRHKSNVVQLTEWRCTFKTTVIANHGSLRQDGALSINFRADVHAHRDSPGQTPIKPVVPFNEESSTSGMFTASGSWTTGAVTTTWSGTATLVDQLHHQGSMNAILCFGSIDASQMKIDIALEAFSVSGMVASGPTGPGPLPGSTGMLDGSFAPGQPVPSLQLALNADFSIPAGVREEIDSGTTVRLEWGAFVPKSPPDTAAARAARR